MAAKFDVLQPKPGEFRWVLLSQGRVLARSDPYTRKAACVKAMESFRAAAPTATIVDHTARPARRAPIPEAPAAKVARTTGRVLGKTAAKVVEAVERVLPG